MANTADFKKDIIYLSIAFILLVILPIVAGLNNNQEWTYYLTPAIMAIFLLSYFYKTFINLKRAEYE